MSSGNPQSRPGRLRHPLFDPKNQEGLTALVLSTPGDHDSDGHSRWPLSIRRLWRRMIDKWQTSAQVKTVGWMFIASTIVLLVLGFALVSFMTTRLTQSKVESAEDGIDRVRHVVEQQVDASDTSNSVQVRINAARTALTERGGGSEAPESSAAPVNSAYEPVLIAPNINGDDVVSPDHAQVPQHLRNFIHDNQVAYQFDTLRRPDGTRYKALIIGSPVASDVQGLELYLIFPMDSDESTLALMRGLITSGGIILLVVLVGIAWAFAQQVTLPVRTASRTAERFSQGHLGERMAVNGRDEMARLATSFNSMANSLSKQIKQLEEYGDLQKQFTSDVSHELRSPLTTVRMAADMIEDNSANLDPAMQRASSLMNKELGRFEGLLSDLLDISRHDSGVEELSLEHVDLLGALYDAWLLNVQLANKLNVVVRFHVPPEPLFMPIDTRRVQRIFRNLIENALDHAEGKPIDIAVRRNERAVSIIVLDHGVGLKSGEEDLVFNRFWRADPSRVRHRGGTGLGLAIARENAALHGGKLDATGKVKVGSCFRLTLPIDPDVPVTPSDAALELAVGDEADATLKAYPDLVLKTYGANSQCGGDHEASADADDETDHADESEPGGGVGDTSVHHDSAIAASGEDAVSSMAREGHADISAENTDDDDISEEELRAAAEMDDFDPEPSAPPSEAADPAPDRHTVTDTKEGE
ncbi:MtrAB system histidine kinase MtrB [Corynebacterium kroppenstedtii]|uniref:MtrAB system histidine kinase MtrB n=1 Tax=Corynebacterium sp. PCR 32 TaxID=3351342 RepID=UPI0030AA83E5